MRDLLPLTRSAIPVKPLSAGPHRLGGLGRSARPASADPDAQCIAVLKSDILALQSRIDVLGAGPNKSATYVTHGMLQQERLLFSLSAAGSEDTPPVTKLRLLEELVSKVGELCTVLSRLGAKTGLLIQEDTPRSEASSHSEGAKPRPEAGGALTVADQLQALALPQKPQRISLLETFLTFVDDWAELCVADFDPREVVAQVSLEDDRQRQLQGVHAHFQEIIHTLKQEHASAMAALNTTHEQELAKLQAEVEELHAAHTGKKAGGGAERTVKEVSRELTQTLEENARLKSTVDALQQMVQVVDEAKVKAFGSGADLTWLRDTLKLDLQDFAGEAELLPHPDAKVEEKLPKVRKPLDEQQVKLMEANHKLHVYSSTLQQQNSVLRQVEDKLQALLADHASALAEERERVRLLEERLAAAMRDRDDTVARLQKTLVNQQAEAVCLRAELRGIHSQREDGLWQMQAEKDYKKSLPLVQHADFPPPLTLPQRIKGQNVALAKMEQRVAVAEATVSAKQHQVRELQDQVEAARRERDTLMTTITLERQQNARLQWDIEQKETEIADLKAQQAILHSRLSKATDSTAVVFERTKDLQLELRKANATTESVKANAATQIGAVHQEMAMVRERDEADRKKRAKVQEQLETELDLRQRALDFAEERVSLQRAQLAELKALLELRMQQSLEALDASTALLAFQPILGDGVCATSQASNIGKRLESISEALAHLKDELDARWHASLTLLQQECWHMSARVAEILH